MYKKFKCPTCNIQTEGIARKEVTRRGSIFTFYKLIKVCHKCGEKVWEE